MKNDLRLLTTIEYAELRRITPGYARIERFRGKGPRYIRIGDSQQARCYYRLQDVLDWLDSWAVEPTSKAA